MTGTCYNPTESGSCGNFIPPESAISTILGGRGAPRDKNENRQPKRLVSGN